IRDFHVTGVQTCALPILSVLVCLPCSYWVCFGNAQLGRQQLQGLSLDLYFRSFSMSLQWMSLALKRGSIPLISINLVFTKFLSKFVWGWLLRLRCLLWWG